MGKPPQQRIMAINQGPTKTGKKDNSAKRTVL